MPPAAHAATWLAVAKGSIAAGADIRRAQIATFDQRDGEIALVAGPEGATFVVGAAVPHPHALHLGYYSVHTSAEALARGEGQIERLRLQLGTAGDRTTEIGNVPVFH